MKSKPDSSHMEYFIAPYTEMNNSARSKTVKLMARAGKYFVSAQDWRKHDPVIAQNVFSTNKKVRRAQNQRKHR